MKVPKNVLWFEVLLYLSLALDALSVAFHDRTPSGEMTEQMILVETVLDACMILVLVYFVWLAAQRRKSWPLCIFPLPATRRAGSTREASCPGRGAARSDAPAENVGWAKALFCAVPTISIL